LIAITLRITPEITIRDAIKGIPLKRTRNPITVPIIANSEIKARRAYQRAGILSVAFQIGLIVRIIPIGPLNITIAKMIETTKARDSISAYYS
jgi:hypothetical protein